MPPRRSKRPPDPSALVAAFQAAAAAADWPGAVAALDGLIALAPDNASLHYNRALALRQAGRARDAVAAADRALALDPAHQKAAFERAAGLMDTGAHADAAAAFDAVLSRDPADDDARHNLARCRLALGQAEAALAALTPLGDAASLEAIAIAAEALRDLGRLDEAEPLIQRLPPARALKLRTHGAVGRLPMRPSALTPGDGV